MRKIYEDNLQPAVFDEINFTDTIYGKVSIFALGLIVGVAVDRVAK